MAHLLLGLLRRPTTGYELKQQLDALYSHAWTADLPQIYRTLNRMELDGWLVATTQPSDRGPDRKVYSRTAAGVSALGAWLEAPLPAEVDRWQHLVHVLLLGELEEPGRALDSLHDIQAAAEHALAVLQATARRWAADDVQYPDCADPHDFYLQLTLDGRIHELQARVAWASRCIHRIEARLRLLGKAR